MESFANKLAVVTGGGSGMGRELVVQLAAAGCSVATCDLLPDSVSETKELAPSPGAAARITSHVCDVSDEEQVLHFRDEVRAGHDTEHVDLVFNNAGIGGGNSFVTDPRDMWERTFAVDWWGVYFCTRAFLPLLMKSDDAVLVNTSSVNGFWASLGPGIPNTAYSAAKFAVKGFTESLIEDFRINAPNVRVAVVMPGHIGTDIVLNSLRAHERHGPVAPREPAEDLWALMQKIGEDFKRNAPLGASEAASIILDGVLAGKWRILVGRDAAALDTRVRADPETAYVDIRFDSVGDQ